MTRVVRVSTPSATRSVRYPLHRPENEPRDFQIKWQYQDGNLNYDVQAQHSLLYQHGMYDM